MTDREIHVYKTLGSLLQDGDASNEFMVKVIELTGDYLNLLTIPAYAKEHKMSYNGVKKCRRSILLFGIKYIPDNE